MSNDSLCSGVYGTSTRKHLALDENISLAFVQDTTVEISIVDAPILAQAADFPRRQVPKQVLVIKSTTPLSPVESCEKSSDGIPVLVGSDGESVELPQQAEIHIPVTEHTLMPFVGRIRLGQSNSSNTPNQLRSGTIAIYRPVTGFAGREDPQLVSSTSLFPGDVVKFQTDAGCLSPSAGFLRAAEDDSGSYIEVVASMRSQDGVARIERRTPGGSSTSGYFTVKLRVADAIFSHPMTLWLGALVTLFVVGKEWLSSFYSSFELLGTGKGALSSDRSEPLAQETEGPNRSDDQI